MLRSEFGIEQRDVPEEDLSRFDPVAGLALATDMAGPDAQLVSVRLAGVRRDGTMDVLATYRPAPDAEYRFGQRLAKPPPNAPPIGAGGSAKGIWYEPVVVRIAMPGQQRRITFGGSRIDYVTKAMERRTEPPVATEPLLVSAPTCSLTAVWQQAIARGAPTDAVAQIEYSRAGYSFLITGTGVSLRFGPDCQSSR